MYGAKKRGDVEINKLFVEQPHSQADSPPVFETVNEWLQQGLEKHKKSIALTFGDTSVTYEKLHKLSTQIANYLRSKGINKGDRVGISLQRSIEMVASIIGILKAGAAYVPLDPNYPVDRLNIMQEDADLSLLIVHKVFSDQFETATKNVLLWDEIENEITAFSHEEHPTEIEAEDIAYVIFTSGSTGRPKGIAMPHRALSNLIEWQLEREYFKEKARVLQYSSISFDVSFQEIATTLASGGTLYLIDDEERRDARILLKRLQEWKIERLFIPFVALRSLIEVAVTINSFPESLKEVITAGEQLRVDAAVRLFFEKIDHAVLDNQYGPSETHVISAHLLGNNPMQWPDLPAIGKPLKNTSIFILDEHMQPVKNGETGELYLAGRNLAHGYIHREDLTRKAFIPSPFKIPNRPVLYKTGDLGFYDEEGDIEFLGRSDNQIKIRGFRVEPAEIDIAGTKFPGIEQCLSYAMNVKTGKTQLVTYFIRKKEIAVDKPAFRNHLAELLPAYMVPSYIVEMDAFPYTPSGKVDFKSLPGPQEADVELTHAEEVDYQSVTEARLAEIWKKLLEYENIAPTADFFELGGDSLIAVTLFLEIEKEFHKVLPLSALVQNYTLRDLAQAIDKAKTNIDTRKFRSLQVMQKGDSNEIPLFLIHGGAGNVLIFRDLMEAIDDNIPIFAFQWSGWDGYRGHDDIMAMAKFYKDELREAWPVGPYRIGGHCIGGVIAIEVAKLLKAEGATVLDPLLVTDSPNLYAESFRPEEPESSEEIRATFKKVSRELEAKSPYGVEASVPVEEKPKMDKNQSTHGNLIKLFLAPFKKIPFYKSVKRGIKFTYVWLQSPKENIREMSRPLIVWSMLKLSKPIPIQDREYYSGVSMIQAFKKHGKVEYDGDILYLRSSLMYGRYLGLQGWWEDMFFGFGEVCKGHFDVHVIGGNHNELFRDPHAQKIIKEKMFDNANA